MEMDWNYLILLGSEMIIQKTPERSGSPHRTSFYGDYNESRFEPVADRSDRSRRSSREEKSVRRLSKDKRDKSKEKKTNSFAKGMIHVFYSEVQKYNNFLLKILQHW